jgi:prepilin-type N-terminal cleavage/methylation domain-containing protein
MSRPDSESGFTLIETLIGMVLTALIAVAISLSMRTAVQMSSKMARNDAVMEAQRTRQLVAGWLALALPDAAWSEDGGILFRGEAGRLVWTVEASGKGGAGLAQYELTTAPGTQCQAEPDLVLHDLILIVREYAPGHLDAPVASDRRVLIECAGLPAFEYLGPDEATPAGRWRDEWNHTQLPGLIKLSVGKKADWIVVRPYFSLPFGGRTD